MTATASATADDLLIGRYSLDDALIADTRAAGEPRVAAYVYPGTAVVLGRGGKPEVELNLDAVRAGGVPVLRRDGGGCAVVLDPGNVIASVALPLPGLGGFKKAFAAISDALITALAEIGVPGVRQRGISDLAQGDRKVGGSCIYRARGLLYYSTTLLASPDIALAQRYLSHPPREPGYRRGRAHGDFMGRLRRESGVALSPEELAAELHAHLRPDAIRVSVPRRCESQ